jgi:3-methyladenine DNA glycosylase AlkD
MTSENPESAGKGKPRRYSPTALCRALREALRDNANPDKAPGMQAYMKSEMPYLGVQTPALKAVCRKVFAAHPIKAQKHWLDTILAIWRNADYREERYAAIRLGEYPAYQDFWTLEALPCYEEMIVDGAWWDYVDAIAPRLVGGLLTRYPDETKGVMLEWAHSSDIWKRRTSIICQLKFKDATDVDLLQACIEPSIDHTEFFLRKAIAWALREYAKTDPEAVIAYITENADRMSTFSKKEALRLLIRSGRIDAVP